MTRLSRLLFASVAILSLRADDDAFSAIDVSTETGYATAARTVPAVRALVRFALSDEVLVAVARAS